MAWVSAQSHQWVSSTGKPWGKRSPAPGSQRSRRNTGGNSITCYGHGQTQVTTSRGRRCTDCVLFVFLFSKFSSLFILHTDLPKPGCRQARIQAPPAPRRRQGPLGSAPQPFILLQPLPSQNAQAESSRGSFLALALPCFCPLKRTGSTQTRQEQFGSGVPPYFPLCHCRVRTTACPRLWSCSRPSTQDGLGDSG